VILINLLPHREAARKRRKEAFVASLAGAAVVGLLVAGGVYLAYQAQIAIQQSRNLFLTEENKRLDAQIKEVASLQAEIAALTARQEAVESLQADRNLPVHLLNELVTKLPDGVYITNMNEDARRVTIRGVAQSNDRVAELLRNLMRESYWLASPQLVEIVGSSATVGGQPRRVANFTMQLTLLSSSESLKLRTAASAPAAASASTAVVPTAVASAPLKK
jgi:type IV pilus assembly protein PilN